MCCTAQKTGYNFYDYSAKIGLQANNFQDACQDSYGFLWLASPDGLFRWDGYTLRKYTHLDESSYSISDNIVYTIYEDSKRRLWIGTINSLNLYNREADNFSHCRLSSGNERIPVNGITEDRNQKLWLATSRGLCRYDAETKQAHWVLELNNEAPVLFCISVDNQNNIWAGSFNKGVLKYNQQTNRFLWINPETGGKSTLKVRRVNTILNTQDNKVWVGNEVSGLTILNNDGRLLQRYKNFSENPGATYNSVTALYEDGNGTVWVGIRGQLTYYKNKNSPQLEPVDYGAQNNSNGRLMSIAAITEDNFGNTWFASSSSGLYYSNIYKNVFFNYLQNLNDVPQLKSNIITCFYENPVNKNIWIGTDGNGLLQFNPSKNKITIAAIPGLKDLSVNDIKADDKNNLWIATWGNGVKEVDAVTGKVKTYINNSQDNNSLVYDNVKTVLPDGNIIWIGTYGEGLAAYDKTSDRFISYKNNKTFPFNMHDPSWINHLFKDSKDRLWISTYSGVYMYDGKRLQRFAHSADPNSIAGNSVNMITEDTFHHIWIAGDAGLDRFDEAKNIFIHYNENYGLPRDVKSIAMGNDNLMWIGTNDDIIAFDILNYSVTAYNENDGLFGKAFYQNAVLKSNNGNMYFGSYKGFNVFNPKSIVLVKIPNYFHFTDLYVYNRLQQPQQPHSPLHKILDFTDTITLTQQQSFFSVGFALVNLYAPDKTQYAYKLEGLQKEWIDTKGDKRVSFTNLQYGDYLLKVRYTGSNGEWKVASRQLHITILPYWWQTLWFRIVAVLLIAAIITCIFYMRVASIKKRNRILKQEVLKRTNELSQVNISLVKQNDEIRNQKEKLEISYEEIKQQSEKIVEQQQQITAQNKQLGDAVEALEKSNTTKDHFFSILAHDLKNPVAALADITGFINQNIARMDRPKLQEYISNMHDSSSAVYELLINLLNWSRTQSKQIEYKPENLGLLKMVEQNVRLLETQFHNKHITLNIQVDKTHRMLADYNMIDTVIRNILSNSIKFTDYNGNVHITSSCENGNTILTIADNGIGMKKEQLKKLFSIDKKNIARGTAGEKGTGLGLVISKEFLEANNGKIKVESVYGRGSAFIIELLAVENLPQTSTEANTEQVDNKNAVVDFWQTIPIEKLLKIKGRKILIADDNKEVRDYLKLILENNFELLEAENGKQAFKIAMEILPDIIISDVLMPEMNGRNLCRKVKDNASTNHIPVVLLTSQSEESVQAAGYEAGADIYLTKPVKKEILIQACINLLQSKESLHEKLVKEILSGTPPKKISLNIDKTGEVFLNRLANIIEANISNQELDSKLICKEIGISRTLLYSKVKTLSGQTLHEFIKTIRLKKSLQILLDGNMNINQVAYEVGFNSSSYYHRCFIKEYGVSPKDYINKKKKFFGTR